MCYPPLLLDIFQVPIQNIFHLLAVYLSISASEISTTFCLLLSYLGSSSITFQHQDCARPKRHQSQGVDPYISPWPCPGTGPFTHPALLGGSIPHSIPNTITGTPSQLLYHILHLIIPPNTHIGQLPPFQPVSLHSLFFFFSLCRGVILTPPRHKKKPYTKILAKFDPISTCLTPRPALHTPLYPSTCHSPGPDRWTRPPQPPPPVEHLVWSLSTSAAEAPLSSQEARAATQSSSCAPGSHWISSLRRTLICDNCVSPRTWRRRRRASSVYT